MLSTIAAFSRRSIQTGRTKTSEKRSRPLTAHQGEHELQVAAAFLYHVVHVARRLAVPPHVVVCAHPGGALVAEIALPFPRVQALGPGRIVYPVAPRVDVAKRAAHYDHFRSQRSASGLVHHQLDNDNRVFKKPTRRTLNRWSDQTVNGQRWGGGINTWAYAGRCRIALISAGRPSVQLRQRNFSLCPSFVFSVRFCIFPPHNLSFVFYKIIELIDPTSTFRLIFRQSK